MPKRPENINYLKQLTGILNFVIRIQDYRTSERIMQCFKCQNVGQKAEFFYIKDRSVKSAGAIIRGTVLNILHTQLGVQIAAGNTPQTMRGKKYKKGGAPREPPPSLSQ